MGREAMLGWSLHMRMHESIVDGRRGTFDAYSLYRLIDTFSILWHELFDL